MTARAGWAVALLAVLAAPPSAAGLPAGDASLEFSVPAQMRGDGSFAGLTWAFLVFDPGAEAAFVLDLAGEATARNHTYLVVERPTAATGGYDQEKLPVGEQAQSPVQAEVRFGRSWGVLAVAAEAIHLSAAGSAIGVQRSAAADGAFRFLPSESYPHGLLRWDGPRSGDGVALALEPSGQPSLDVVVEAVGLRSVEWHNATVECGAAPCPDGARPSSTRVGVPTGHVTVTAYPFTELLARTAAPDAGAGTLRGSGRAFVAAAGGPRLDVGLDGWGRFPAATLSGCGGEACDPAGRTLQSEGRLGLEGLAPVPGTADRVASRVALAQGTVRHDESLAPALLGGAAVAGAAALGAAALAKLLLALFARNHRGPLGHPRAKALHDLVHAAPGLSFRALKAETGWGHGSLHYHLRRLQEAGLIVAYPYRNTVRYYENHGRYKDHWQGYAALRVPEARRVHEWLLAHPGARQADLLAATAAWGWKRSTTQHRLGLLLDAGLALRRREGRAAAYSAVPVKPPAAVPTAPGAPAAAPATPG